MSAVVVLGSQWGDEGKGRLVDLLAKKADIVVRFSGGNNAGHTVVHKDKQFLFTILPSGALSQKKLMISAGTCFDPKVLVQEINLIKKEGLKVDLTIDPRVHIVMPYHCQRDLANEAKRGKEGVGSVGFGIGYCFVDRARRGNVRFEDLIDNKRLKEKIAYNFPRNKDTLMNIYGEKIKSPKEIFNQLYPFGHVLKRYFGDVSLKIQQALKDKKTVLFEGSQGVLLDVNFGTYPYTTGCHTIAGYIFTSVGLPPMKVKTIGVVKSFCSRADIGRGPFPTEIPNNRGQGKRILEIGHEYEEFPGIPVRPRRIGWLDLPMLRYSHRLNGFYALCLTHIDTLGGLKKIKVCTHYQYKGKKSLYPKFPGMTDKMKPLYKNFDCWEAFDSRKIRRFEDLPMAARNYVSLIEKDIKVPIKYISVGPERESIIEK